MKYLMIIFLFVLCLSCENDNSERHPNIVLIMADDMGIETLGCNGNIEYHTPNLDRIANSGVRFEHCYSQPLCTPSRVKIMTGKYNFRNYEDFGYLNPSEITFGNLLKDAGYATCIAGKWQLNGVDSNNPNNQDTDRPYHFGFDEYCLWQLHHTRREGERFANALITQNGEDLSRDPDIYGPQVFADFICDFIEKKSVEKNPFLIYYPMVLVHDPFVPTPDSPEWENPSNRYKRDTAYFADMVAFTDKIVGQIEAKLKEKNVWENTIFIFTGDNGTNTSIYSSTTYGVIQGGKGLTENNGNHVPFFVSWPQKIKQRKVVDAIVSFNDVLPTLCDAAGITSDLYKTDGKSLLPLVTGEKEKIQEEIFIHYTPRKGKWQRNSNRWVMNNSYKLYQDGRFLNTANDMLEQVPLQHLSEKERKLKEQFQQILVEKEKEVPFSLE